MLKRNQYNFFYNDFDPPEFDLYVARQVYEQMQMVWVKTSSKPYSFRIDFKTNTKLWGLFITSGRG